MKCMYQMLRSKKYTKYFFCKLYKQEIILSECKNCSDFSLKKKKSIKNKTTRLKKLEQNRYSILTNNFSKCYFDNEKKKHIHEIYKGSNRQTSMKNGFCIPICEKCHIETEINPEFDKKIKQECQKKYEEIHTREEFIKLIGKSYL